ncbi:histidinol dehydrogenase [Acinetobacter indicus]|uniref:Histidinol dehydrogenase n=1 Tax=Acinetobacter indicus CIP 110367 TaxID=1341679 RepID=V2UG89_9GAMM|nr:histidinol dehydrogenase [Acinetobacter indicus]EPF73833.1 histidinol dehydrogenase [Acinetobacter indicus ANC 4215]ESK47541.1 histidinol dehydrogenase [Acinetobacter indicus CIP 110367]
MKILKSTDQSFENSLSELLSFETVTDAQLVTTVDQIIQAVRVGGDDQLLKYTQQFDQHPALEFSELVLSPEMLKNAFDELGDEVKNALEFAAQRIRKFHEAQLQSGWTIEDQFGNTLGQKVTPLDRVGIYVPGGLASYPSSGLMNAIPAMVAGVSEIIMVVPAPKRKLNQLVLAAAYLAGVDQVFTIGGAQAVAALAYGTESIPRVDKITGPGNKYVAAAKRAVFGQVGIDMIAGPSEIAVYAESDCNPEWLAMDLLSQAEHDPVAQAIFITDDEQVLQQVHTALHQHLEVLPRGDIARESINNRGAMILVRDRAEGIDVINRIAPEQLQLCVEQQIAQDMTAGIRHAGAIFIGKYTVEAVGDYCAGPNHVLPTSGTARFSSPLGVYDFQKRSSLIMCSEQGVKPLAHVADILAQQENLDAHARSARYRT